MRVIVLSGQYKKDLKLARRRNLPEEELNDVIFKLANDIPLGPERHDHSLNGKYSKLRECHIQSDWLLVYSKEDGDVRILNLYRTGTHSDIFKL